MICSLLPSKCLLLVYLNIVARWRGKDEKGENRPKSQISGIFQCIMEKDGKQVEAN